MATTMNAITKVCAPCAENNGLWICKHILYTRSLEHIPLVFMWRIERHVSREKLTKVADSEMIRKYDEWKPGFLRTQKDNIEKAVALLEKKTPE